MRATNEDKCSAHVARLSVPVIITALFACTFVIFWMVFSSKFAFAFAACDLPWRVTTPVVVEVEVEVEVVEVAILACTGAAYK